MGGSVPAHDVVFYDPSSSSILLFSMAPVLGIDWIVAISFGVW
jgi:hypothetical protein